MTELILKKLKQSKNKEALIFLTNRFRYFGLIKGFDEKFIELQDYKSNSIKIIAIDQIAELEIKA